MQRISALPNSCSALSPSVTARASGHSPLSRDRRAAPTARIMRCSVPSRCGAGAALNTPAFCFFPFFAVPFLLYSDAKNF